jgi:arabidopsis histidine kinase 2/3/4 (cytokinin receptor)
LHTNAHLETENEIKDFKQANMMVKGDQLRLKQVLNNLCSNAYKFTKEQGSVTIVCQYVQGIDAKSSLLKRKTSGGLKVADRAKSFIKFNERCSESFQRVFRRCAKNKLIISVVDSGVGMDLRTQKKIFKMFGTLNHVDQDLTKGIGIGLRVSEQIISAMKGHIGFRSQERVGSQFSFSFMLEELVDVDTDLTRVPKNSNDQWALIPTGSLNS